MSPKEKAKELVNSFNAYTDSNSLTSDITDERWHLRNMKQCALIAVDEVLNAGGLGILLTEWWEKVKQEINKL